LVGFHNGKEQKHPVTEFPHIRGYFNEAYVRLIAMKLYSNLLPLVGIYQES